MVNYSSYPVYASAKLVRTDSAARMSSVSTASSSTLPDAMWAASGLSGGAFHSDGGPASLSSSGGPNGGPSGGGNPADDYFQFNDEQQDALLQDARANAAALVVDVLADVDKWQFVATRGSVNVFELRSDAADRVSSMVPPPAPADAPVAFHSHTMLAMTRVRAKLDDFMRIMAAPTRDRFQDVQTCLYEDRVQLADVFTSFGGLSAADVRATPQPGNKPGRSGSSSSSSSSATATAGDGVDMEQFAVKYMSLKGATPKKRSGSSLSSSSSSIKLRRRKVSTSKENDDEGLTFCLGEYATIRRGNVRGRSATASPATLEDQRIGIIAQHSLEDPAVTKWCKPIMLNRDGGAFAVASRSLAQFSGMVVYPVASAVAGENLLEVLVKLSVYDPRPGGIPGPVRHNMLTYLTAFAHLENALLVMRLRASPYLTSRNWNRGGRGARKCCSLCQAGFSSFRRKHHCRLCGEVTCSKCSDVHQIKLGKAGKCPFRICAQCAHGTADALRLQRRSGGSHADEFDLPPQGDDDDDDDEIENDTVNKPTTPVRGSKFIAKESGSELYDSRGLLASSVMSQRSNPSSSSTVSLTSSRSTATGHSMTTSTASSSRTASDPPAFLGVETASVTSSTASPLSPSSAVEDSDSFYQRFSEMSLMDFHDSEFDLSIKGMGIGAANGAGRPTGFEFDDSERGSDNELDDIGEEDEDICDYDVDAQLAAREIDIDAQPTIPIKTRTVSAHEVSIDDLDDDDDDDDDESGMEFHDSEVGIEFDVSEVEVIGTSYGSAVLLEELEEIEDDVDEVIHTNSNQHRADLAYLDEQRAARLQAYAIMDSGKEMIYDVVAKQAAQHLGCALATISFVDASREFVKASFGVQMGGSEIPKQHSLTAHLMRRSVLEDVDVVVVSDARRDDLLSGNVFVYERPGVRFVAGVPVKSSDGVILGALLVADTQPRSELPAIHRSLLRDLAEQVAALLEDRLSRQPPPPTTGSKAGARPGQMREQLADLLSQSYHTGLQVQQNEQKLSSSFASSRIFSASSGAVFGTSGSLSASAFKPSPQLSQSAFDPNFSRIKPKFHTPANYQRNGIEL